MKWHVNDMLEIKLSHPDDFLKIKETLTRIGVEGENKTIYQSCHILQKQGRYYITHFKELFILDGKPSTLDIDDIKRRNRIAALLQSWSLLEIVTDDDLPIADMRNIKVISHAQKDEWNLQPKYIIGRFKSSHITQ